MAPARSATNRRTGITPLPGTLDGAIDRLALCDVRAGTPFTAEGAAGITLHCVLDGTLFAQLPGRPIVVVPTGSALLLPGRTDIRMAAEDGRGRKRRARDVRVLIGSVSAIAAAALGLGDGMRDPVVQDLEAAPGAAELLTTLLAEVDKPGLGTVLLASALMKLYLVQAARRCGEGEAPPETRVSRAITAIVSDPGAPHSIASLADLVRMSRATFIRHFSRVTGTNPMQFVAKARLDHAAELLRSTALPIKTVAAQTGFQDRSHFSRAFRRAHGADPSAFRRASAAEPSTSA